MTKEALLQELQRAADNGDPESAHENADEALLLFIDDNEIREAYCRVQKWYS